MASGARVPVSRIGFLLEHKDQALWSDVMGLGASAFPQRHLCGSSLVYGSLTGFGDEIIEDLVYCHALQSELIVGETEICARHLNATDLRIDGAGGKYLNID